MRQLLASTVTEARPQLRESSPTPTIWPFLAAIAVGGTFLGSIFTPWAVVWGAFPIAVTLIGWFWPSDEPEDVK
jgi:cytochrome c oxidase subunit 1